ncbi:MAG TPA: 5'-methylthioadenosine/S-adenosylhomocysteine nucleosidase [Bryobacteraceae bacterium]|nr:5'-methylthioadenosine/S-adenosylhomocysteine nucleosidase [Bryobacteraceae bacterium]
MKILHGSPFRWFILQATALSRLLALFALFATASGLLAADRYDLMIEGAVDFEIAPLLDALQGRQQIQLGSWTYWTGRIGSKSVVIARTEQGPINAAASTAFGIDRFHPAAIIDQGTAGAHNPDYDVFDIVLGAKVTDFSASKSDLARSPPAPHELRLGGHQLKSFTGFEGDAALLATARNTPYDKGKVQIGNIGSAYAFDRQIDFIRWVRQTYGTDSEDMESAYAAGVAAGMQIPFLAIRIISNSQLNHPKFEREAGTYCAQFVLRLVRSMK